VALFVKKDKMKEEIESILLECEAELKRQRTTGKCWDKAFSLLNSQGKKLSKGCSQCYADTPSLLRKMLRDMQPLPTMTIYQTYYSEETKKNLKEGFTPYDNTDKLTMFFESGIIRELVSSGAHKNSDYFGVVSHDFRAINKPFRGGLPTKENIARQVAVLGADVVMFNHVQSIDSLCYAENWHNGIVAATCAALESIGYKGKHLAHWQKIQHLAPARIVAHARVMPFAHVGYENHIIARSGLYEQYCNELLFPVMRAAETDSQVKELFLRNSNYVRNRQNANLLQRQIGINYYPLHPFICERLWGLWLNDKTLKVLKW
jgi:hypothetical protein